jgi:hypothetical protein
VAIGVDAGDKRLPKRRIPLCRGHGTRKSPRRLDERGHGYILISVGRRVAPDPRRAIGRKVS